MSLGRINPNNAASVDQDFTTKCFPDLPWPFKDWCKARGGSAPPPWRPNPNRGDQSVPNYVKEAVADITPEIKAVFFVAVTLTALWLGTRVYEAWKR
jgi:hypothetical protein